MGLVAATKKAQKTDTELYCTVDVRSHQLENLAGGPFIPISKDKLISTHSTTTPSNAARQTKRECRIDHPLESPVSTVAARTA